MFRARDTVTGDVVAAKRLRDLGEAVERELRREVCALRLARLPGVVSLIDSFTGEGGAWIVMELVDGARFGRPPGDPTEAQLDALAVRLVRAVAHLHLSGMVHSDLKPANVFLRADGRVCLLDLGLAGGPAIAWAKDELGGCTPAYAAPEQRGSNHRDPVLDVFALGAMLIELYSGVEPVDLRQDFGRAGVGVRPFPAVAELLPHASPARVALIERMVHLDPAQRPRDAVEVLGALGVPLDEPIRARIAELPVHCSDADLAGLVHGVELLCHRMSDAVEQLRVRTGGDRRRVEAELVAWLQTGSSWEQDGRAVVDRDAVGRLRAWARLRTQPEPGEASLDGDPARALRVLRAAWPFADEALLAGEVLRWAPDRWQAAVAALEAADLVWRDGETLRCDPIASGRRKLDRDTLARLRAVQPIDARAPAMWLGADTLPMDAAEVLRAVEQLDAADDLQALQPWVEYGLAVAAAEENEAVSVRLLAILVRCAHAESAASTAKRAIALIEGAVWLSRERILLLKLARMLITPASQLDPGEIDALASGMEWPDERMELVRRSLVARYVAQQGWTGLDAHQERARVWAAGRPNRLAAVWSWEASLAYRLGDLPRMDRAVEALLAIGVSHRITLNAEIFRVQRLIEARELGDAMAACVRGARAAAAQRRHVQEAQFEVMRADCLHRMGERVRWGDEMIEALEQVCLAQLSVACMVDAANAWRAGDLTRARQMSERGRAAVRMRGMPDVGLMLEVIGALAGEAVELAALVRRVPSFRSSRLKIQAYGALASIGATVPVDDVARLYEEIPEHDRSAPLELCSCAVAAQWISGAP